ncbi:excalibur calcium-binding domain-containing protein [Pseudomonas linyingensis]|uniref:excalibur calcium-binding domain-containing protein n=1 Tax=Pseudomonas linyingensis TaxID=915471 RepID=UPI000B7DCA3E|nr:excalibur calcium-binding domain-containing protein [Pseudomonas linyingensis]
MARGADDWRTAGSRRVNAELVRQGQRGFTGSTGGSSCWSSGRWAALPVAVQLEAAPAAPDARKSCSQMTSCAEARFHLEQCGNTKLDGNGDGVPCESLCR